MRERNERRQTLAVAAAAAAAAGLCAAAHVRRASIIKSSFNDNDNRSTWPAMDILSDSTERYYIILLCYVPVVCETLESIKSVSISIILIHVV